MARVKPLPTKSEALIDSASAASFAAVFSDPETCVVLDHPVSGPLFIDRGATSQLFSRLAQYAAAFAAQEE
jgi:hypothetical protein